VDRKGKTFRERVHEARKMDAARRGDFASEMD
jgi:hypothetical protein